MALIIEYTKNLTTDTSNPEPKLVGTPFVACEPGGDTGIYYTKESAAADKAAPFNRADYPNLKWNTPRKSLTSRKVDKIGIKHFPRLGAIGFYKETNARTAKIKAPIHAKRDTNDYPPEFTLTQEGDNLKLEIKDGDYDCYRIICRSGNFTEETITYESQITIPAPKVGGTYEVSLVGYHEDTGRCSLEGPAQQITVAGTQTTWEPLDILLKALNDRGIKYNSTTGAWEAQH